MYTNDFANLQSIKLPRYQELPNFGIYSEQLVDIIRALFTTILDDEQLITKSMINNYVKHKLMPAPIKKKYYREHIAYAIVIVILKNVLTLNEIHQGILHELTKDSIEKLYDYFANQFEKISSLVMDLLHSQNIESDFQIGIPMNMENKNGLSLAILSFVTKIVTKLLLKYTPDPKQTTSIEEDDNE